jgi:hypothetical protein
MLVGSFLESEHLTSRENLNANRISNSPRRKHYHSAYELYIVKSTSSRRLPFHQVYVKVRIDEFAISLMLAGQKPSLKPKMG